MMNSWKGTSVLLCSFLALVSTAQKLSPRPVLPVGHLSAGRDMTSARGAHTATTLLNFKVLIAGGDGGAPGFTITDSTEIYDPTKESFTPAAKMTTPRQGHVAALLSDGKVLIAGGVTSGTRGALATSEDYDVETNTFTPRGSMHSPRVRAAVTVLRDGSPLVTGGTGGTQPLDSAETYSVLTGKWTLVGKMAFPRVSHTSTLLSDGRVLVVGGVGKDRAVLTSAEIYDPKTKLFTSAGEMHHARCWHAAALLSNGKVLIVGGLDYSAGGSLAMASAELYDPATHSFTVIGNMAEGRSELPAPAILLDGRALVVGGAASAELLDPIAGTFRTVNGSLDTVRHESAAVQLMDGSVRIFGGYDPSSHSTSKTWIYRVQ